MTEPDDTPEPADKPAPLKLAVKANPRVHVPVLLEDPDLLIIDKPAGAVVQPGKGHASDSLLNGLFALRDGYLGKILHNLGERRDYGLLHRLDKETSGLIVVAKSPNAYDQLRRDFEDRKIEKEYTAFVLGVPAPKQGVVQARLKEITAGIKKSIISRQGQEAISAYRTVASTPTSPHVSLVKVLIKTGRLHQIRAHMLFLNTPLLGDDIYTPSTPAALKGLPQPPRLCLHAGHLGFKHPITNKWLNADAPLPTDLARYATRLGLPVEQPKPRE